MTNGHPDDRIEEHASHVTYREPLLLYHNNGRILEIVSAPQVPFLTKALLRVGWPSETSITTARSMY